MTGEIEAAQALTLYGANVTAPLTGASCERLTEMLTSNYACMVNADCVPFFGISRLTFFLVGTATLVIVFYLGYLLGLRDRGEKK